jgi:hypothetical protein
LEANFSTDVKYHKKVIERIFKIETDEFEVCKAKKIAKRKRLFFQQVFVVHLKRNGDITWEELR